MSGENLNRLLRHFEGKLAEARTVSQGIDVMLASVTATGKNAAEEMYLLLRQHPDLTQAEITGNIADRLVVLVGGVTTTFAELGGDGRAALPKALRAEPLRQAVADAFLGRMQELFEGASSAKGGAA